MARKIDEVPGKGSELYPLGNNRLEYLSDRIFNEIYAGTATKEKVELFLRVNEHSLKYYGGSAGSDITVVVSDDLGFDVIDDIRGMPGNDSDDVYKPETIIDVPEDISGRRIEVPGEITVEDDDWGEIF